MLILGTQPSAANSITEPTLTQHTDTASSDELIVVGADPCAAVIITEKTTALGTYIVNSSSKEPGSPSVVCDNNTLETSSESEIETGTMPAGCGQPLDRGIPRVTEVSSPEPNIVLAGVHNSNDRAWQTQTSPGLGTRYKTHDMNLFAPAYKSYAESSADVRTKMEREAVIANVLRRNQRKICEEHGIPPDVFSIVWEEYRESHTFKGRFFHRDEILYRETNDNTLRMQAAIAAYRKHVADGTAAGRGEKGGEGWTPNIWKTYGVAKASFYKSIAWEDRHPGMKWSGNNIRQRGKVALLTEEMENELNHWVAISQRTSGGVEQDSVCRVGYALMASDPAHYAKVQMDHKEYRKPEKKALSRDWFFSYRKKFPDVLRRHRAEGSAVGRAQVTRAMIDSVYDCLQVVLTEADALIPASNIWNFDETGTKVQYARTFLYGLCGSQGNQAELNGAGEHVTVGATANLCGDYLDPAFLFVGAQSSKANLTKQLLDVGFENPLVLMKKGKASMDDILFTEYLQWFAEELVRKGYKGQHILMVDNHDSHERSRPIEAAMLNNLIIFTFPSHCTHLVQMLDVSFFKSLKSHYKKVGKKWLDEECLDAKPYISKSVFLRLIHRAWVAACQREVFTQGWARMGLKACPSTGMVIINRNAIGDCAIGASVKYTDDINPGTLQSVRVKGAVDETGVIQYHDYDFDFSGAGLDKLSTSHPHVYGMYLASRTHLLQQPGFVMHQRMIRPCKPAKLAAQVLTTSENLVLAKEKDARKKTKTNKKKMTALATIGKDLGKVVSVDGVALVAPAGRGERNVYCEFCKRTLTRVCKLASCKKKAAGETLPCRKVTKRKRPKDEWTSDDDSNDGVLHTDSECDFESFIELMATGTTEPWVQDPKGRLSLGLFFNAILLTDEPGHAGHPAKVTDYYVYNKTDNVLDFTYANPQGGFETEIATVQDVYEAIIASQGIVFPKEALALHD